MRKILFYYSQLNIGGAEKSIIRLMNAFVSKEDYVTYLGRFSGGTGEYLLDNRIHKFWLSNELKKENRLKFYASSLRCIIQRLYSKIKIKNWSKYDIAFIGLQGLSPELIVNYVNTSKICIFIRTDLTVTARKQQVIANLKKYFNRIDYFICVAETVKESLIKEIPEATSKAVVIYNILSVSDMHQKLRVAINPFKDEADSVFRIVTVCRISDKAKAIFRMVRICRKLVDDGYKFRWYIIGDGADLTALRQAISESGLDGIMITPGKIDNPFGYYRECDLVAMLSYYEGLCGVVNETKVSGKAIIATKVSGIYEQIQHGLNGWIVDNDEGKILEGMKYLLENKDVIKILANTIYPEAIINDDKKIEKLYKLIE